MPGPDPSHWLLRLTADEWLAAATTELGHCEAALRTRAFRTAITHARRAAGMALNAALTQSPGDAEARWGRSYMDHVRLLCDDELAPEDVRRAAADLRDTPPAPPELVTLGAPDPHALRSAARIVDWVRAALSVPAPPVS